MAFSLFCIFESMVLIMNALAILNDRFLKKGKSSRHYHPKGQDSGLIVTELS